MIRRAAALLAAVALVGGCNSKLIRPPATIYVDGGESSVTASVGEEQLSFPAVLLSFIPSTVALHPGDSVRFDMRYNGEPHTVALGTMIDAAVAAIREAGPGAPVSKVEQADAMKAIPDVFPREGTDDPKVNRSAAERCFLDQGSPPVSGSGGAEACPEREQPAFDGTQSFISSGFLPEGEGFRIKLSDDIQPGTYSFMCLVHRSRMTGSIEVKAPAEARPNVREVKLAGRNEQDVVAASVATAAKDAATPPEGVVRAGAGPTGEVRGFASAFIPRELEVAQGQPVTWQLYEMHAIAFRPDRKAREGILLEERDGTVEVNVDAWHAVDSPRPPPEARTYLPPSKEIVVDGGSYDGSGPHSSGILRATSPAKVSYTLTFTASGKYPYFCLVHDQMRGTIRVV